jgi:hypothetical protein
LITLGLSGAAATGKGHDLHVDKQAGNAGAGADLRELFIDQIAVCLATVGAGKSGRSIITPVR